LAVLNWLDRQQAIVFLVVLFFSRMLAMLVVIPMANLLMPVEWVGLDFREQSWAAEPPTSALLFMLAFSPLLETAFECLLPYWVLFRKREVAPSRPWAFIVVSASLMALVHAHPGAVLMSLVTGAFLAYCFAHFAKQGLLRAFLVTSGFHAAINVPGWLVLIA
jgi:hypothetical protein